jgi:hypothetical protein
MIYNANRHIYILKESFGLTEIQLPKNTSETSRFCLYFSVTVCLYFYLSIRSFVSRGGDIGRATLMLSIYIFAIKFSKSPGRCAISKHWYGAFEITFIYSLSPHEVLNNYISRT